MAPSPGGRLVGPNGPPGDLLFPRYSSRAQPALLVACYSLDSDSLEALHTLVALRLHAPTGQPHTSPGQSEAATAAQRRPGSGFPIPRTPKALHTLIAGAPNKVNALGVTC